MGKGLPAVVLAVASGVEVPAWADRRIRARASFEAERAQQLVGVPVLLIARVSLDADGRLVAGIAHRLYHVTRRGLVPIAQRAGGVM